MENTGTEIRDEVRDEARDKVSDEVRDEVVLQAKKKAMRLLEFSDRTEKQLRDKLEEGKFPPFAIEEAIQYVKSFHYLDDARFAENLVRNRNDSKSRQELMAMMLNKGISRELAEAALETVEFSEKDSIKSLFLKKYGRKDLSDPKLFEKAFRYFASKGYSFDDIKNGIREAIDENGEA